MLKGKRLSRGANFSVRMPDIDHPYFTVEVKYRKKLPRLLTEGLEQAHSYDLNKIPLLFLKERYMRGGLVVMKAEDFKRWLR